MARTQNARTAEHAASGLQVHRDGVVQSTFQGLFSEIDLAPQSLGKKYEDRNAKLCTIIQKIAEGLAEFSTTSMRWAMPTNI
jgi:type I restriction enzyme M protein